MAKPYLVIFNLIVLFVLIYMGVDIFYRVVSEQTGHSNTEQLMLPLKKEIARSKKEPLKDYDVIVARNIFGSVDKVAEDVSMSEFEGLEPTSLKIALLGTVAGNQQTAVAVIEEIDKKKQGLYKVGDSVQDARIKVILRGKVVLRVGTKDEILTMEENSDTKFGKKKSTLDIRGKKKNIRIDRSDIRKSLDNVNKLMTEARVRPYFKDGKSAGISISRIKENSIFEKLNLKNGDVVQGINGKLIKSPDDILGLYKKLKSDPNISVDIMRKGERHTIGYNFQ